MNPVRTPRLDSSEKYSLFCDPDTIKRIGYKYHSSNGMKLKSLSIIMCFIILACVTAAGRAEGKTEADTFSFFRGDIRAFYDYSLAHKPSLGKSELVTVQLHGDPHIENFGMWWGEGGLDFGLIDFDETARGPFYLDLERLGVGLVLVSHERGLKEDKKIVEALGKSYLAQLEKIKNGQVENNLGLELRETYPLIKEVWGRGEKGSRIGLLNGYGATSLDEKGERVFNTRNDFVRLEAVRIRPALDSYLESLPPDCRKGMEFYRIKDAVEVRRAGVGSRGNLKFRLLIEGPSAGQDDDYILELREAKTSVLPLLVDNQALRIWEGQKIIQGVTSPFIGYAEFEGKDFFVDEVCPYYNTVRIEDLKDLKDLLDMASLGGKIIARAHYYGAKVTGKKVSDILGEIVRDESRILDEIEKVILDYSYISELKTLQSRLHGARDKWMDSIEDKYSEENLARAYKEMQAYCRDFLKKYGSFEIEEMKILAEEVRYPYEVSYNDLYIEANRLEGQLFNITTPGTVANSYYQRPSEKNLASLKALFDRIYQYYTGKAYSWNRYLNKYLFQKSRLGHYSKEWSYWEEEYRLSPSPVNKERAKFCYDRLKKENQTNNLPLAGEVNAFYLSRDFDNYYDELLRQEKLEKVRREKGYEKEVLVLVHGLGEDRSSWKTLPYLLADEDTVNPGLKKYFKVYLFRFDTIEDSKSVSNFTRELSGFIREVQNREKVEKVNIIAHSLGGVITLKYLAQNTDPDFDLRPPGEGKKLITSNPKVYRNNIKRFIGLAPSFSGSKVANAVVELFKKPEAWFEDSVKAMNKGNVPSKGDIQVEENQIGSLVNLDSFERINLEKPLDPVKVLTIIGIPPRLAPGSDQSRGKKEFGISEDDGLVRVYSANLNHYYFQDNELRENIGYQKGSVRYLPLGHFELAAITSREHLVYKYIVSFLNDNLLPQEEAKPFTIKTFGIVLRVAPAEVVKENADIFFSPAPKDYYIKERLMVLPELEIELAKDDPGFSPGIIMQDAVWNNKTGAYFSQGSFSDEADQGRVVYRLKTRGYKTRIIFIPVTRGELSYAPHLILEKE